MFKPYIRLSLASTLFLAGCSLTAPNTSSQFGGIGQNPCLENTWKSSAYCKGTANLIQSTVQFVASHSLLLEPIPLALQRSGLPLALVANALSSQTLPQGAQVEFFLNGKSLGRFDASTVNDSIHTFFDLLSNLTPGQYEATAVLLDAAGNKLANSNTIIFNVPETINKNLPALGLLGPTTQQPMLPGTTLEAIAVAHIPENKPGTTLVFRFNGQEIPATRNPDGTYRFTIDTTGLSPGSYPLTAVLKDANGQIISESTVKSILVAEPIAKQEAQLQLFNLSGTQSIPQGNPLFISGLLNIPDTLKQTGQKIEYYVNGQKIAEAIIGSNGHYTLTWQTQSFATGKYTLTAKVLNPNGSVLVTSNALPIEITGAAVAQAGVQLGSIPSTAFPGSTLPLVATPTLPANVNPNSVKVVFTANGQVIGEGIRQPDGSYLMQWNTAGHPLQNHEIVALLQDNTSGETLATSAVGKLTISHKTPIDIHLNSGNVSAVPGARVALSATLQAPPELLNHGAYVEFRQGNTVIGRGTRQSDGAYLTNFDTTGYAPGAYPVEAVLRNAQGQALAVSNRATITLASVPQNTIVLTSTLMNSAVGSTVPLTAQVTLAQTTIATQTATVRFISNGELLGTGVKQPDGSFRLDWDTHGRNIGRYPVQAVLIDSNGQALAESIVGIVNLQSTQSVGIHLVGPTQGSLYSVGSNIPLEAAVGLTPAQQAAGVTVEFWANAQRITAIESGSGKYTALISQPSVGDYTVRAILKSAGGSVLSESPVTTVRVESSAVSSGGGGGGNGSIGTVTTPTTITPSVDLTRPSNGGGIPLGTPTELQANAVLSPVDVANGYQLRFRDPLSGFSETVVPTRANTTTTTYTASVLYTPNTLGEHNLIVEVVNSGGHVVGSLTDTHTVDVVNTLVNMQSPADNSVVTPNSNQTLTGTATNIPPNGTVRFVIKDNDGNILTTLPATNTGGDTWSSPWLTPNSNLDVNIEMQVLAPGTENPLVTDTHDVAVIANSVETTGPINNAILTPGAYSNAVTLTSGVPALTPEQITHGATVFFDVLDNNGAPITGLSNLIGVQQGDNTWQVTTDLSGLAEGNYHVRAKVRESNQSTSNILYTDPTPNAIQIAEPSVTLNSPADNTVVVPSSGQTLSGTATHVPTNGIVQFVVKNSSGTPIATLPATHTSGDTWSTTPQAWTAPANPQDVTIEMQVIPPGASTPADTDTHNVAVVSNRIDTTAPVSPSALQLGATGNSSVLLRSDIPVATEKQWSSTPDSPDQATVYFEVRNNSNTVVAGPFLGVEQANDTWQVNADLSALPVGDYKVVAQLHADNSPSSPLLAEDPTPSELVVVNSSVTLTGPVNNSTFIIGETLNVTGTALNVPPSGFVSFILKDSNGTVVRSGNDTDLSDNNYGVDLNTTGTDLKIGTYTLAAQVKDAQGKLLSESTVNTLNLMPTGTLETPLDNTLFYHESGNPSLQFIPRDANGNILTETQLNGATIEFVDLDANNTDTIGTLLGNGTRQGDGSYTRSWDITGTAEPSGDHRLTARIVSSTNTELFSTSNTTRLQPYPRSVFIVDQNTRNVYNTYTGTSVGSQNAVIPDLNTGNRDLIFNAPFTTVALAKHPTNGAFYYIESGNGPGKHIAKYDPSTAQNTIITTTTTNHGGFVRLAFDTVSRRLYASEGNNIYEVDVNTGSLTLLPLSFIDTDHEAIYTGTGGGGDLAITPEGYVYVAKGTRTFGFKLNASSQTLSDGFYTGEIDLSGVGGGTITSNGFDGDIDSITGRVQSMLIMTTKGKFLRIPLNTSTRALGGYVAATPLSSSTKTAPSAPVPLATYTEHTAGDMTAAHTGL